MSVDERYAIEVQPVARYLAEQSDPADGRFAFAYVITIRNTGSVAAQLVSRHWIITDANGRVEEVRGLGVVGEQPQLAPGQAHRYASGAVIATSTGTMRGSYQMLGADGTRFEAPIPEFALVAPGALH